jgi:hypothetical protein
MRGARRLALRVALVGALCLLLGARTATRVRAQDAKAAAEQYLTRVILTQGEVLGYRFTSSTSLDVRASGGLAGRRVVFEADPPNTWRGNNRFALEVIVYQDAESAQRHQLELEARFRQWLGPANCGPATPLLSPDGVDTSVVCDYQPPGFPDIAWRRGQVHIWLSLLNRIPGGSAHAEAFHLANQQNDKSAATGPMTAGPAPVPAQGGGTPSATTPAQTPTAGTGTAAPSEQPKAPDMLLLVTARVGGLLVREGTVVRALVQGKECGRATMVLGFTAVAVSSGDSVPGCGSPGATITFTVGDDTAIETVVWGLENFATPVSLSTSRAVVGGGLVVRPTLVVNCIPAGGECSDAEKALWAGNLEAWVDDLRRQGEEPTSDLLLRSWLQFRAQRGEVFGSLALAFLDSRPFTFVLAVRYAPSATEPEPYVSLFNFGADRNVGGWTLRMGDAVYTFPEGATLGKGLCRVFGSSTAAAADVGSVCPGASFESASAFGAHGYVALVDSEGQEIDSVAW